MATSRTWSSMWLAAGMTATTLMTVLTFGLSQPILKGCRLDWPTCPLGSVARGGHA